MPVAYVHGQLQLLSAMVALHRSMHWHFLFKVSDEFVQVDLGLA